MFLFFEACVVVLGNPVISQNHRTEKRQNKKRNRPFVPEEQQPKGFLERTMNRMAASACVELS